MEYSDYLILYRDVRGQCLWFEVVAWDTDSMTLHGYWQRLDRDWEFRSVELFDDRGRLVEAQPYDRLVGRGQYLVVQFTIRRRP